MPAAILNGIEIYYEDMGSDNPVVFVHGLGLDSSIFDIQIRQLQIDYCVIRYDLRGHGKSSAPETGYSYQEFAQDLKALIDYLELPVFHLVGLSMGGAIAIRFALENPGRAKSLSLIGTHVLGYSQYENWPNFHKLARTEGIDAAREAWQNFRLFETIKKDEAKFKQISRMIGHFPAAYWLDPHPRYDEPNDLERVSEITIPVLITVGGQDHDFLPIAQILKKKIPQAYLIELNAGHLLSFEEPDRFNLFLREFLRSVDDPDDS